MPLAVAFVALVVGLLGAGMSAVSIWQKHGSDKRDALWQRCQLAVQMSQSADVAERELGTDMINMLLDQDELSRNDAALLRLASTVAVASGGTRGAEGDEVAAMRVVGTGSLDRPLSREDDDDPGGARDV